MGKSVMGRYFEDIEREKEQKLIWKERERENTVNVIKGRCNALVGGESGK